MIEFDKCNHYWQVVNTSSKQPPPSSFADIDSWYTFGKQHQARLLLSFNLVDYLFILTWVDQSQHTCMCCWTWEITTHRVTAGVHLRTITTDDISRSLVFEQIWRTLTSAASISCTNDSYSISNLVHNFIKWYNRFSNRHNNHSNSRWDQVYLERRCSSCTVHFQDPKHGSQWFDSYAVYCPWHWCSYSSPNVQMSCII